MKACRRHLLLKALLIPFGIFASFLLFHNQQPIIEKIETKSFELYSKLASLREIHRFEDISECSCSRIVHNPSKGATVGKEYLNTEINSSCSDPTSFSYYKQNIVSFSLFLSPKSLKNGTSKKAREYTEGLLQNLRMMRKYYPGYSARLYTTLPLFPTYCPLVCNNSDLFWCNVNKTPSHGDLSGVDFAVWRFLPLGDPTVDVFLSRDLDSLISAREEAVVKDWLMKGDKAISVMRDRKGGHNVPILAGMWQANNTLLGWEVAKGIREEMIRLSKKKHYYGLDQMVLAKVIFKKKAENIVAYDAYNCVKWGKFTLVRPFPTQRQNPKTDFVGNRVSFVGGVRLRNYNAVECPVECRPDYGKQWVYC